MERNSNHNAAPGADRMPANALRLVWRAEPTMDADTDWQQDECFNEDQLDAMLCLLQHLVRRWPGFAQGWLLRRATGLPRLHGRFSACAGRVAFSARDGSTGYTFSLRAE